MQDRIEKFIREHRAALDVHEPRVQLWDKLDESLQQRKAHSRWRVTAIAASLFLVVFIASWAVMTLSDRPQANIQVAASQNEAKEAEVYYTGIVEEKQAELGRYAATQPQLYSRFKEDLSELRVSYARLKAEYATTPEKEIVLQAMIENLQLQTQIIELQLDIMKKAPRNTAADTSRLTFT